MSFQVTIHDDSNPGNAPLIPAAQSLIDRLQTRAAIRRKIRMGEADRIADDLDAAVARIQALEQAVHDMLNDHVSPYEVAGRVGIVWKDPRS